MVGDCHWAVWCDDCSSACLDQSKFWRRISSVDGVVGDISAQVHVPCSRLLSQISLHFRTFLRSASWTVVELSVDWIVALTVCCLLTRLVLVVSLVLVMFSILCQHLHLIPSHHFTVVTLHPSMIQSFELAVTVVCTLGLVFLRKVNVEPLICSLVVLRAFVRAVQEDVVNVLVVPADVFVQTELLEVLLVGKVSCLSELKC